MRTLVNFRKSPENQKIFGKVFFKSQNYLETVDKNVTKVIEMMKLTFYLTISEKFRKFVKSIRAENLKYSQIF